MLLPSWSNRLTMAIAGGAGITVAIAAFVVFYWFTPKNLDAGYEPVQPIAYSHRMHAGVLGMDCRSCHSKVETSPAANLPDAASCMGCHKSIKTDSAEIKKLKSFYDKGVSIPWVRVHRLPDYASFDHSRHISAGVSCFTCHGRVDQMDKVRQVTPLSMSWCLDCHRNPAPSLRPADKITDADWTAGMEDFKKLGVKNAEEMGRKLIEINRVKAREDCSACHR